MEKPTDTSRLDTENWPLPGRPCSAAAALHLVGDRWSLLIVRELIFGNHRFDQIARNTGAPRDRLAARLTTLIEAGVVERVQYQESPRRFEYHLTEAGSELVPVIRSLQHWGDKWAVGKPPAVFFNSCGHELRGGTAVCPECGAPIEPGVRAESTIPGWDVSGPVTAAD